jgi:hypothetical protein
MEGEEQGPAYHTFRVEVPTGLFLRRGYKEQPSWLPGEAGSLSRGV